MAIGNADELPFDEKNQLADADSTDTAEVGPLYRAMLESGQECSDPSSTSHL